MRFKPPLLDRYVKVLREQFNSGVMYRGDRVKWDTLIGLKVQEFARFLVGRRSEGFDLKSPAPVLERSDSKEFRDKILSLSASEARKLGLAKSTLHDLRVNARSPKAFKVYQKVVARLNSEP